MDKRLTSVALSPTLDRQVREVCGELGIPLRTFCAIALAQAAVKLLPLLAVKKRERVLRELEKYWSELVSEVVKTI